MQENQENSAINETYDKHIYSNHSIQNTFKTHTKAAQVSQFRIPRQIMTKFCYIACLGSAMAYCNGILCWLQLLLSTL